jgi:hypothetical protein
VLALKNDSVVGKHLLISGGSYIYFVWGKYPDSLDRRLKLPSVSDR